MDDYVNDGNKHTKNIKTNYAYRKSKKDWCKSRKRKKSKKQHSASGLIANFFIKNLKTSTMPSITNPTICSFIRLAVVSITVTNMNTVALTKIINGKSLMISFFFIV